MSILIANLFFVITENFDIINLKMLFASYYYIQKNSYNSQFNDTIVLLYLY